MASFNLGRVPLFVLKLVGNVLCIVILMSASVIEVRIPFLCAKVTPFFSIQFALSESIYICGRSNSCIDSTAHSSTNWQGSNSHAVSKVEKWRGSVCGGFNNGRRRKTSDHWYNCCLFLRYIHTIFSFNADEVRTFKKVKIGFSDGELIQRCQALILSNFGTKNPEVSIKEKICDKTDF